MKLRSVALALAFVLALVLAKPDKADAGTYISFGSHGVGISFGYGGGYGYYPRKYYYQPYYGYRSSYYRPYRKRYYGSYYYPTSLNVSNAAAIAMHMLATRTTN